MSVHPQLVSQIDQSISQDDYKSFYRKQTNRIEFDPLLVPPDIHFCLQHQRAAKMWKPDAPGLERCSCCQKPLVRVKVTGQDGTKFKLKCFYKNARDIRVSSKAIYYYLKSFKMMLVLSIPMGAMAFFMTLVNLASNQNQVSSISLGNASPAHSVFSSLMNSVLWIVLFFVWNRLRKKMLRKITLAQQEDSLSPESYALVVKGLKLPFSEEQLLEHFNLHFRKDVQKVDFIYDLQKLIQLLHKLKQLERQRQVVRLFQQEKSYRIMRFQKRKVNEVERSQTPVMRPGICCLKVKHYPQISQIERRQRELKAQIQQFSDREKSFKTFKENISKVGIAIVTLRIKKDVQAVVQKSTRGLFSLIWRPQHLRMGKSKLTISRAPAPSEIIWENLSLKFSMKRFLLTWGITMVVLVISGLINLSLSGLGEGNFGLSLLAAMLLLFVNKIIKISLFFLSKGERHSTLTQFETSKMARYLLATFINTALIPFFNNLNPNAYFQPGGLINDVLNVFLVLTFLDPFLSFLDIRFVFVWIHQKYIQQKGDQSGYTQQKANRIFGGIQPAMSEKYADFMLNYLVAMFYLPIFPLGALLAVLGFWLEHFIEMMLFLRAYQRPPSLSNGMAKAAIVVILIGLLLHLFTNIYFHSMVSPAGLVSSIIITAILCLIAFLLWCYIRKYRLDRSTRSKFWRFIFTYVYVNLEDKGDGQDGNQEYPQEELLEKDYTFKNPMTRKIAHMESLCRQIQNHPEKEFELSRDLAIIKSLSFTEYAIRSEQGEMHQKKREKVLAKLEKDVTRRDEEEQATRKETPEQFKELSKHYSTDATTAQRLFAQSDDTLLNMREKQAIIKSQSVKQALSPFRQKGMFKKGMLGSYDKSQQPGGGFNSSFKRRGETLPPVKLKASRTPAELLEELHKVKEEL